MKKVFTLFLVLILSDSILLPQDLNLNLFKIERSKNANIVAYDIRILPEGSVDRRNPIDVYWLMNAEHGQRHEVSSFEKRAYGYKASYNKEGYYNLILKALPNRQIQIVNIDNTYKAMIKINDEDAYLLTVYVSANNSFIPKVEYITLAGESLKTHNKITEKITIK